MPLKHLADNDVLGNQAAHFFKTGNIMRSKENDELYKLRSLLPVKGNWDTPLDYDVWYNHDEPVIHGYTYTDVMSKFIYIRPASTEYSNNIMRVARNEKITDEGIRIWEELQHKSGDKYKLRKKKLSYPFVIFLPGTNILEAVVDKEKVKRAIAQGAHLKCHPLTAPGMVANLKHQFGHDKIIDKKVSGHQLLEEASIVGCCKNSEMGLVALTKGKTVYIFNKEKLKRNQTYEQIYDAVWAGSEYPNPENLKRIFSAKYSGLIPYFVDNPQEYIDHFFTFFKGTRHAVPRRRKK